MRQPDDAPVAHAPAGPLPRPRRVLIVKPSALGDVATAVPVLRGLRRTFGDGIEIDWLLARSCAPLVAGDPDLSAVVLFDRHRLARAWRSPSAAREAWRFWRHLRRGRYDWVIDLQGLLRSGLFAAATRAPVRAGFATAREGAAWFYTHVLPAGATPTHTVDRNLALAQHLGIDAHPADLRLHVTPEGRAFAEAFRAEHGAGYVVVAPATRWKTKLYPAHHWRVVVAAVARHRPVVLVAAPGETRLTDPLAGGPNVIDLGSRTTIPQLVGVIAGSAGVISCDSATMNIATATGVPQVTLIGPTDPARTGPYRRPEAVVATPAPCRGCLRRRGRGCDCMEQISPTDVLEAAERNFGLPVTA